MGVRQSGRLSEASLTDFMWHENTKSPFLLPLLSSTFQPITAEIPSQVSRKYYKNQMKICI